MQYGTIVWAIFAEKITCTQVCRTFSGIAIRRSAINLLDLEKYCNMMLKIQPLLASIDVDPAEIWSAGTHYASEHESLAAFESADVRILLDRKHLSVHAAKFRQNPWNIDELKQIMAASSSEIWRNCAEIWRNNIASGLKKRTKIKADLGVISFSWSSAFLHYFSRKIRPW